MTDRSWLVLTDGYLKERHAKTAHGVLRYSKERIAAVLDAEFAGQDVREVLPELHRSAPIVGTLAEALQHGPTSLLLGVATPGGWMPSAWRALIGEALEAGLEIVNGLHQFLTDDPEFVGLAEKHGARLWDVRKPPSDIPLFSGKALEAPQKIVATVGSDCAIGKKTVAIELARAGEEAGTKTEFVATGQTGVLIAGRGIAIDRVVADFAAGAAEKLILESDPASDVLIVEGQGSLWHPAYSGVTLSLLHGSCPHMLVMCHQVGRDAIEEPPFNKLPPLRDMIQTYERMAASNRPARVACIALNTRGLQDDAARAEIDRVANETGLPTGDVLRGGAPELWAGVAAAL